jgi:hypothetical protein
MYLICVFGSFQNASSSPPLVRVLSPTLLKYVTQFLEIINTCTTHPLQCIVRKRTMLEDYIFISQC